MIKGRMLSIATAPKRNSRHWVQGEISWEEILEWVDSPGDKKESGNYLLGTIRETTVRHRAGAVHRSCTNIHRRKNAIVSRSAIALDVDFPDKDFVSRVEMLGDFTALIHTTFSSAPDELRYRVIIPTDRDMAPDEYILCATTIMKQLGEDQFDPGSGQPERYMFRPAAQREDWFSSWVIPGSLASVDTLLKESEEFEDDLRDVPMPTFGRSKRDPFSLGGAIGAFNRAYQDLQLLIEEYQLPYEPAGDNRWHLIGSRSQAGMGLAAEGIIYSHHANDPAYGQACTAFDLARLHLYGELDEKVSGNTKVSELPSQKAMLELAGEDALVRQEMAKGDFDDIIAANDFPRDELTAADLKLQVSRRPSDGQMKDVIGNWDLLMNGDPIFCSLYFNELTMSVETTGPLPWRSDDRVEADPVFGEADRVEFQHYIEREYKIRPGGDRLAGMILAVANRRPSHPIRDYLESLEWDGEERLETSLPGVLPTPYTRMVARKCLVAAVARIFEPGCKWDHTLILHGPEGLGKSMWINRMSQGYTANLGRIGDKDTLLIAQRTWILTSDEGHSLRKSDADATKEFLTRQEDVFRMPFDRETRAHPRRFVIWGTTNDEVFLRQQEGNRRYLIVRCEEPVDFESLTDQWIDQVWAEAVHLYREGELLYFDAEESMIAAEARELFIEEDALAGVLSEYLDQKVPSSWESMSPDQRVSWMDNRADGFVPEGTETIEYVCTSQLWTEALRKPIGDHRRSDLIEIGKSLRRLGWEPQARRQRITGYGPQNVFRRPETATVDQELEDLI